ncbi:MAG: glucose-1-phosphate adenylyltransferase, partial [Maritimibacter sp.]|nr:glucose-1-phosphate adenylyltransferase [Maritimibacter sp.]
IDAYWQANVDLTDFVPELDIYDRSWPIWTYSEIVPPAKFIHDEEGRRGAAISSLIAGDTIISGSVVKNSLISTGGRLHSYSSVTYSVLLPRVQVNRSARLKNCVVDSDVSIPAGLVVGEDPEADARYFRVSEGGITLITRDMVNAWLAENG